LDRRHLVSRHYGCATLLYLQGNVLVLPLLTLLSSPGGVNETIAPQFARTPCCMPTACVVRECAFGYRGWQVALRLIIHVETSPPPPKYKNLPSFIVQAVEMLEFMEGSAIQAPQTAATLVGQPNTSRLFLTPTHNTTLHKTSPLQLLAVVAAVSAVDGVETSLDGLHTAP
jgi:hypothetical protein